MEEKKAGKSVSGRALGDEWQDWDGDVTSHEGEIHESARPFALFLVVTLFVYWCAAALLGYLILPRLKSIHPQLGTAVITLVGVLIVVSGAWSVFILISAGLDRPVLVGKISRRLILRFLNRFPIRIAKIFGYSCDRTGHSFVQLNNILARSSSGGYQNTIVLLPRCLRKDVRARVLATAERFSAPTHTVGGGEQARRVITREEPDSIVAIACERDLTSGIIDTNPTTTIIGIPNIRRDGPCRNTEIDMAAFEQALGFFISSQTSFRCRTH